MVALPLASHFLPSTLSNTCVLAAEDALLKVHHCGFGAAFLARYFVSKKVKFPNQPVAKPDCKCLTVFVVPIPSCFAAAGCSMVKTGLHRHHVMKIPDNLKFVESLNHYIA